MLANDGHESANLAGGDFSRRWPGLPVEHCQESTISVYRRFQVEESLIQPMEMAVRSETVEALLALGGVHRIVSPKEFDALAEEVLPVGPQGCANAGQSIECRVARPVAEVGVKPTRVNLLSQIADRQD